MDEGIEKHRCRHDSLATLFVKHVGLSVPLRRIAEISECAFDLPDDKGGARAVGTELGVGGLQMCVLISQVVQKYLNGTRLLKSAKLTQLVFSSHKIG